MCEDTSGTDLIRTQSLSQISKEKTNKHMLTNNKKNHRRQAKQVVTQLPILN